MYRRSFSKKLRSKMKNFLNINDFKNIFKNLSTFNTVEDFRRYMKWKEKPQLLEVETEERDLLVDINNRRLIDAEIISYICKNMLPRNCLEIGTSYGVTTARMAVNAPQAKIYTVNIPPEDFEKGGKLTTHRLTKEGIGRFYREKGLKNIHQIYADTADWLPQIPPVDIAFIDGSHDAEFVYNDTIKVIKALNKGSFLLWHDFNPDLHKRYNWIYAVMQGIEYLYEDNILKGDIYHVRNSWICIKHFTSEKSIL